MVENIENICENIDRATTLEIRAKGHGSGIISKLYERARDKLGQPLSLLAAQQLNDSVSEGDFVIVSTGFVVPPFLPNGEIDGIPGAVTLSRALTIGLKAKPILLGEQGVIAPLEAGCITAGLRVTKDPDELKKIRHGSWVSDFPIDDTLAEERAKEILDNLNPSAIIVTEKNGPNRKGVIHTGGGKDMSHNAAKLQYLVEEADRRDILTIGIGDFGNEIGFGIIEDAVREIVPTGNKCTCPCGDGIACATPTDVLIIGGNCEFGAWSIEAALSALLEKPELLHDAKVQKDVLDAVRIAGAMDPHSGLLEYAVSAIPGDTLIHLLEVVRQIVKRGLQKTGKGVTRELTGVKGRSA